MVKKVYAIWIYIDVTLSWINARSIFSRPVVYLLAQRRSAIAGIFIKVQEAGIVLRLGEPFRVNIMKNRFNIKLGR
jgi:hypothetical protein